MLIHLNKYFSNIKRQMQQRVNDIKLFIENLTGYSFFELGDAFLSANLFVILFKFYWAIGGIKPTIGINLCMLFCFFLLSLELEIAIKMRENIRLYLEFCLGVGFVLGQYVTTSIITNNIPIFAKYCGHLTHLSNIDFDRDSDRYNYFIALLFFYFRIFF